MSAVENGTFNGTSEAERKTQSYYLSCLNQPRIDQLGAQPLIDLITKVTPTPNPVLLPVPSQPLTLTQSYYLPCQNPNPNPKPTLNLLRKVLHRVR